MQRWTIELPRIFFDKLADNWVIPFFSPNICFPRGRIQKIEAVCANPD
jgi:hypothetical protein